MTGRATTTSVAGDRERFMIAVRRRDWFQDAYIRIAALIIAGAMLDKTPSESVTVIEGQLERAYRRGVADAKAGRV